MHAENAVVDDDGEREEVEHVREVRPHMCGAVLAHAFGVEAVCLHVFKSGSFNGFNFEFGRIGGKFGEFNVEFSGFSV